MGRAADVRSVDSIRAFRADLVEYQAKLRLAVETLHVELSRGEGWFENQKSYWPAESRRTSDKMSEALAALSRCMLGKGKDRPTACDDERKELQNIKQRLRFTEQQANVTKRWTLQVNHDTDEFRNRLSRLVAIADGEIPRALASLDRIAESLDRYTEKTNRSAESSLGTLDAEPNVGGESKGGNSNGGDNEIKDNDIDS